MNIEGIVLKTYAQGEADSVVSLFTPEVGKSFVKAKGAKKITAKLGPHLQPLARVVVATVPPVRGNLPIAIGADTITLHGNLQHRPGRFAEALAALAIVDAFSEPSVALPGVYEALAAALAGLDTANLHVDGALERVVFAVLEASGLSPEVQSCVLCARRSFRQARMSAKHGGLLCATCAAHDREAPLLMPDTIALLRLMVDNTRRSRVRFSARQASIIRDVTRRFVEYVAPRPLYAYHFLALFA